MPNERNQLTRQAAAPDTVVDPAADFVASNLVLKAGQFGFEDDTGLVKLGDGVTAWNDLDYFGGGAAGAVALFRNSYVDPANEFESISVKPAGNFYPATVSPAQSGVDPARCPVWELNSDYVSVDSESADGLAIDISSLGPGRLIINATCWVRFGLTVTDEFYTANSSTDVLPGPEFAERWDPPWYRGVAAGWPFQGANNDTAVIPVPADWPSDVVSVYAAVFGWRKSGSFMGGEVAIKAFQYDLVYVPGLEPVV